MGLWVNSNCILKIIWHYGLADILYHHQSMSSYLVLELERSRGKANVDRITAVRITLLLILFFSRALTASYQEVAYRRALRRRTTYICTRSGRGMTCLVELHRSAERAPTYFLAGPFSWVGPPLEEEVTTASITSLAGIVWGSTGAHIKRQSLVDKEGKPWKMDRRRGRASTGRWRWARALDFNIWPRSRG